MKRFYILILVALLVGASVSAQEVAPKESVDTKLEKLEKRTATLEKLRQYLRVSGFIQTLYEWHDADKNN